MRSRSISAQLILLLTVPLVGATFFGVRGAWQQWTTASTYASLRSHSTTLGEMGQLIHELQRERGRSGTFISSKGAKFSSELPAQQQGTDRSLRALRERLAGFDAARIGAPAVAALERATRALDALDDRRTAIRNFGITPVESTAYFTATIAALIEVIDVTVRHVDDAEIASALGGYVRFVQAKEHTGIERALLSTVFNSDAFSGDLASRVGRAQAAQAVYLAEFAAARPDNQRLFDEIVRGPAVDAVERMRTTARERAAAGGFGIDAGVWFDAITTRIDLMKQVEDRLAATGIAEAQRLEAEARLALMVYAGSTAVIVLATALYGAWTIRSIVSALRDVVERLAAGADRTAAAATEVQSLSRTVAPGRKPAGGLARRDQRVARGDREHDRAQRRVGQPGAADRGRHARGGRRRGRRHRADARGHGCHHAFVGRDRQDRPHHRRDRVPDQPARAQRGRRGRQGWRSRGGVRGGGRRGARARAAVGACSTRDGGQDRGVGRAQSAWRGHLGRGRGVVPADRRTHGDDEYAGGRDRDGLV
jgi:methyl-accepting chemotaxis protein